MKRTKKNKRVNSIYWRAIVYIFVTLFIISNYEIYAQTEPVDLHEYIEEVQFNDSPTPTDYIFGEGTEIELDAIMLANPSGGIAPLDIVYVSVVNCYYIYGYHRISVVNATTHQIVESINISNFGVTSQSSIATLTNAKANRLAYNTNNNELYCITEDRNFIVIDVLTNTILESETTNLGDPNSSMRKYHWTFIDYDTRTNKVFVSIIHSANSNEITYYNVFDANTHNRINYKHFPERLNGFTINEDRDRVYMSFENKFQVWDISATSMINEIVSDRKMGNILYINNSNSNIHKAICFPFDHENAPNAFACVFNGDDDNNSTFQLSSSYIFDSEYNPASNKIYYSYRNPGNGVKIISAINYTNISNLNWSNSNASNIKGLRYNGNNKVIGGFCMDGNRIRYGNGGIIIDGTTNDFVEVAQIPNGFNYQTALNDITSETAIVNFLDASVSFVDNAGIYIGKTNLGGSAKQGIYNEIENKVYTYNKYIGKVFINDLDNNQSTVVDIGYIGSYEYISGVVYDKDKNQVYISIYSDTDKIKIIDGVTDQILSTEIDLFVGHCNNIFYGGNNKLYCAIGQYPDSEKIEIIDLNTYGQLALTPIFPTITNLYYNTWFDLTNTNDIIVCINDIGDYLGTVEIIDKDQNIVSEYYVVPSPYKIAYNSINNKVYTGNFVPGSSRAGSEITVIDLNDGITNTISVANDVISMEFCDKQNYLAVFGFFTENDMTIPYITTIDGKSDIINSTGILDYLASGIKYNPINGNLYVLMPINQALNETMEYLKMDHFHGFAAKTTSSMQERYWGMGLFTITKDNIIVNSQDNQLIIPTGYHSQLNVLQCDDEQHMLTSHGYNWLSYPKLDRDQTINEPYSTRSLLENLDPLPDNLILEGKAGPTSVFFTKEGSVWIENQIPTVQSTRGYKLSTTNNGVTWLPLTGTRIEPDYPISVFTGYENWVGYFLLQHQSPLDAFADLLPEMTRARGHDWTMVKFGTPGGGDPIWILQPQDAQLRYGDMATVEVTTDRSFQWFEFGTPGKETLREPEQFTYTELADYTPIFIEPDPDNQPIEIGAFVNDTCIGACVVEPADTLVLLRGYMTGEPGDSVVFENYYGTKSSSSVKISDYYVLNHKNKLHENRTIKLGENTNYHYVSFKKPIIHASLENLLHMEVYPNPMSNQATIAFVLPTESNIKFDIINQMGKTVGTFEQGILNEGFHSISWDVINYNGNKLKAGLYTIRLMAGGNSVNRKIIVN